MYNNKELEGILGIDNVNTSKEFSYENFAGIQGEGYLVNKYILSEETITSFKISINKNEFPLKDSYKEKWELIKWNKGMILNANILDLFTVFNKMGSSQINDLKNDLNKENNFYSVFYKDSLEDPYAIEIYIINPETRVLWVVNVVT